MSLELIVELAASLSKIETLVLEFGETDDTTEATDERIDRFYQVLNAIVGDRNISSCTAQFTDYEGYKANISIRENSNLFYRYRINPFGYNPDSDCEPNYDDEGNCRQSDSVFCIPIPSFDCSIGPQVINNLDCIVCWWFDDDEDFPKDCLQYASENFPNLNTFKMTYFLDGSYPEEKVDALSARQKSEFNKSCLEDITIVSLTDVEFSQSSIDVLLIYFPKMKTLDFVLSKKLDSDWRMDLACFSLEQFTYLTSFRIGIDYIINVYDTRFVYYKFAYGDIERTECFEFGKEDAPNLRSVSTDVYYRQEK